MFINKWSGKYVVTTYSYSSQGTTKSAPERTLPIIFFPWNAMHSQGHSPLTTEQSVAAGVGWYTWWKLVDCWDLGDCPPQDHLSFFFHFPSYMWSKIFWARIFLAIFMCSSYIGSWWQMGTRDKIQTNLVPDDLFLTLMLREWFIFLLSHLPLIHLEKNSYPEIYLHSSGQGKGSPW